jgi:hypothetical protein
MKIKENKTIGIKHHLHLSYIYIYIFKKKEIHMLKHNLCCLKQHFGISALHFHLLKFLFFLFIHLFFVFPFFTAFPSFLGFLLPFIPLPQHFLCLYFFVCVDFISNLPQLAWK